MADFNDCLGLELKLTKNVMENEHNKYLKNHCISGEQGLLLKYVYEYPGSTQTQLSDALRKDKTTITRMIDTLEKKGKLYRESFAEDRRVFKIYLTEESRLLVEELTPLFEQRDDEVRELIGEEDYRITVNVLKKIRKYYEGLNK